MTNSAAVKKEKIDVFFSVLVNIFTLLVSVLLGFFIPRFLSVETYSNYRTYCLYSSYVGIFHLGFINGIYLKYGSFDYKDLPKSRFRTYTLLLVVSQVIVQIVLIGTLIIVKGITGLISPFLFVVIIVFFSNINIYFTLINQFTKRFRLDMLIQLFQNVIMAIGFSLLLFKKVDNYIPYLVIVVISNIFALIVSLIFNTELFLGKINDYKGIFKETIERISCGFPIMIGEFMGIFIVTIDVLIVNLFFSIIHFSIYSFAYSVITFLFQLTAVIAKFIFPYLKRMPFEKQKKMYDQIKLYILVFSSMVAGLSLLFGLIIPWLIPKYADSVNIVKILGISVIIRGVQELVCGNFFKALNNVKAFAKVYVFALVLAVTSDIIAFLVFGTTTAIAIASVITFCLWYLVSDIILQRKMEISNMLSNGFMLITIAVYCICSIVPALIGILAYFAYITILTVYILKRHPLLKIISSNDIHSL